MIWFNFIGCRKGHQIFGQKRTHNLVFLTKIFESSDPNISRNDMASVVRNISLISLRDVECLRKQFIHCTKSCVLDVWTDVVARVAGSVSVLPTAFAPDCWRREIARASQWKSLKKKIVLISGWYRCSWEYRTRTCNGSCCPYFMSIFHDYDAHQVETVSPWLSSFQRDREQNNRVKSANRRPYSAVTSS